MIRVALLSQWHVHAKDYARQAHENPAIEIAAVWDERMDRGQAWATDLGVPFYPDLDTLLNRSDLDGVIVNTPTVMHRDVIIRAAEAGKHIFSEKVLALTTDDVQAIFHAVDRTNVHLMLSLPRLSDPCNRYAEQAVQEGLLGELTSVRCRVAHNGAVPTAGGHSGWLPDDFFDDSQTGGGAMIDLGAHPIYLTNRVAGAAKSVTACLTSYFHRGVDDNSIILVEYQSGALGVIETGFVSSGSPFLFELYGTAGSLLIEEAQVRIKSQHFNSQDWVSPQLPARLPTPMEQWTARIEDQIDPSISRDDMYRLSEINQAALRSSQQGIRVIL
jgi:predicted dehydrogenase